MQVQPLHGIKLEFLLARFAWTLFDSVKVFLKRNVPRWLKPKSQNGQEQDLKCSPEECRRHASRPQSTSPSKRARTTQFATGEEIQMQKRPRSSSTSSSRSTTLSELATRERALNFTGDMERGRKRRRSFSPDRSTADVSDPYLWPSATELTDCSFIEEEKKASTQQCQDICVQAPHRID